MCCDNCDHYFRCADVEHESALCCGKCEDQDDCHGTTVSGRHMMVDYEDEYDDLLDDADDDADLLDDDDEDDDDYDDDYDEDDSTSIH